MEKYTKLIARNCEKRYTDIHLKDDIEASKFNLPFSTNLTSNGKTIIYLSKRSDNQKDLGIVKLDEGFEYIARASFQRDQGLKGIEFNEGFKGIGESAFDNCAYLKRAVLNNKIEFIDDGAFRNCISLTSIYLPSSLQYISPTAFACSGLRVIVCDENMDEKIEKLQKIGMLSKIYVIDKDGLCVDRKSFKPFQNCVDDEIALKAEMKAIENMILANPENIEVLKPIIDRIPVKKLSAFLIQYRTAKPSKPKKNAEEVSI